MVHVHVACICRMGFMHACYQGYGIILVANSCIFVLVSGIRVVDVCYKIEPCWDLGHFVVFLVVVKFACANERLAF